jgi:hypothetical protein
MGNPAIPDEALFYIAERGMSVDQTLDVIYDRPSPKTREHFVSVNPHLKNDRVRVGQMVIVTPENSSQCSRWEAVMMQAAETVDAELAKMSQQERDAMARNYALISNAATYSSTLYGWTNTYFQQKKAHVERILKQIEQLYKTTYNKTGGLKSQHFFSQRRNLFMQLDQTINGMMERKLFGHEVRANQIKSKLGLSSKAIVHQWKMQGGATEIDGFKSNYAKLTRAARTFSRVGYVAVALDVGASAARIKEACTAYPDSNYCKRTSYSQTGRAIGSIGGGVAGGTMGAQIGAGACALLFGVETGGLAVPICIAVFGVAGGYAGGKVGGKGFQYGGEVIYETTVVPKK